MKIKRLATFSFPVVAALFMSLPMHLNAEGPDNTSASNSWENYAEEIQSKAKLGDADAEGLLSLYIQLQAIPDSEQTAYLLAEKSAAASSAFGIYALGRCYETGIGTAKDELKAQEMFAKSFPLLSDLADNDGTEALWLTSASYSVGRGVTKDDELAKTYATKAVDRGFVPAVTLKASILQNGFRRKQNEEAMELYEKAANQGYPPAQFKMGCFFFNKQGSYKLTYEEIEEAIKWLLPAAEKGHSDAQSALGQIYGGADFASEWYLKQYAKSINFDKEKKPIARKWHSLAANNQCLPSAVSQYWLGQWYETGGFGFEKDEVEAAKWFQKAAEAGNEEAQKRLAMCYLDGRGVPKNKEEAAKWFNMAGQQQIAAQREMVDKSKKLAEKIASDRAAKVEDTDPEKYGGPPTLTIMKLMDSGSSNDLQNTATALQSGLITAITGINVKEIKRGEPLMSMIGEIPAGTKVFPIRLVFESPDGSTSNLDYYFYKDEFGEWFAKTKN